MSPSSMSSWAGVWKGVTLEPSNWKRTCLWAPADILDRYWEKMESSGASWNTNNIIGLCPAAENKHKEEDDGDDGKKKRSERTLCRENSCEESRSLLCSLTEMKLLLLSSAPSLSSAAMTTHSAHEKELGLWIYILCSLFRDLLRPRRYPVLCVRYNIVSMLADVCVSAERRSRVIMCCPLVEKWKTACVFDLFPENTCTKSWNRNKQFYLKPFGHCYFHCLCFQNYFSTVRDLLRLTTTQRRRQLRNTEEGHEMWLKALETHNKLDLVASFQSEEQTFKVQ